jgi:hypothetical protein
VDLRLVGHQRGQHAPEPGRLGGEVDAPAVALVEDQVHDRQHGGQPLGQDLVGRDREGDPRLADLDLGPRQAALHRLRRDEERVGDLLGRQAAERAQRQRDLRLGRQRGMAAREDELQALVGDRRRVHVVLHRGLGHGEQPRLRGERALAAQPVDRAVARGGHQPGAGVVGRAGPRPALRRHREGLLDGLLGEVEVAEEADQGGEHTPPLVAEDLLDQRGYSRSGRISIAPPRRAAGIVAARAIAASRSSASKR